MASANRNVVVGIGEQTFKFIEVEKNKILNFSKEPLNESSKENAAKINRLFSSKGIKAKTIILYIHRSLIWMNRIALPLPKTKLKREQIINMIYSEVKQFLPASLDETFIEYATLDHKKNTGKMEMLVFATAKEAIQQRIKVLEEAGLKVSSVHLSSTALTNMLKNEIKGDTVAIINAEENKIEITIVQASNISLSRTFAVKNSKSETTEHLPALEDQYLGKEVMASFNYFKSLSGGDLVKRIILVGEWANAEHTVEYLSHSFNMPVKLVKADSYFSLSKKLTKTNMDEFVPLYAASQMIHGKERFNILPASLKEKFRVEKAIKKLKVVFVLYLLTFLAPFGYYGTKIGNNIRKISTLKNTIKNRADLQNVRLMQEEKTTMEKEKNKIVIMSQVPSPDVKYLLERIFSVGERKVALERINLNNDGEKINISIKGSADGTNNITEFLISLQKLQNFSNVVLVYTNASGENVIFEITSHYNLKGSLEKQTIK